MFPIRLETQEGLIDQLVQIKMLGLPDNYLNLYRDEVQAITIEEIQRVATKYVKPDEAAIVIVGDGAQILNQLEPYSDDIEFFSTSGKRKDPPAKSAATTDSGIAGTWELLVQTPFGQEIPATLTLTENEGQLAGHVHSEMGEATLATIKVDGSEFEATLTFDMDGNSVAADIRGKAEGSRMDGNISLQNLPALPFTGSRQS